MCSAKDKGKKSVNTRDDLAEDTGRHRELNWGFLFKNVKSSNSSHNRHNHCLCTELIYRVEAEK